LVPVSVLAWVEPEPTLLEPALVLEPVELVVSAAASGSVHRCAAP